MENFLTFLDQNSGGLRVLAGVIVFIILIMQWLAWIFHIGRYKKQVGSAVSGSNREKTTQFVFGEFLAKVISDFRNLLAVLIILVFAIILAIAIFRSDTQEEMASALQAVMATLGGLVGLVLGYYFGESAVKSGSSGTTITPAQAPMQNPAHGAGGDNEQIMAAPAPPAPSPDAKG